MAPPLKQYQITLRFFEFLSGKENSLKEKRIPVRKREFF